ncbi:MAG TPA: CesT family type III secretion system chaperone [Noviherbaspirillum sp.]|uniref:CesT family type III secretion system chaperone n=1 Tax=Noviherbaspirillum sp. TaxID=1926288 RepID=UPI002B46A975|nr:CesT family type III secretion system chaperone [Noviherbaspirillum sp.]HJV85001.1 CesT family type III secretion system chaperone [Noviherbaspirillum sp.]
MDIQFQNLMTVLLQHMGIDLPPDRRNDVYTISVDQQLQLKLFSIPVGYLNVIADLGKLPDASGTEALINLLKLNCFTPIHPELNFKLGYNEASGNVELWTRKRLNAMSNSDAIELLDFALETARFAKDWIDRPMTKQRSQHHLSRLMEKQAGQQEK